MNGLAAPRYAIFDGFLADDVAQALVHHALQNEALFEPAAVGLDGAFRVASRERRSLVTADLGPARADFTTAVEAKIDSLLPALGLEPFALAGWDIELAAHRDGGYFREHIDTMTADNRPQTLGDRIVSLVCYLHRPGACFTGGELVLRPFVGRDGAVRIEPRHNRLVAFPSFARHEVEPIHVPGNAWEDARFSINCWLLRAREA